MLRYLEVQKVDPRFEWIEIKAEDEKHDEPTVIRQVIGDGQDMATSFVKRYCAKRDADITVTEPQNQLIREFFEEVAMAKVMAQKDGTAPDYLELLPTTLIHFKYPEQTSFRKSRAARILLFQQQAMDALQERDFEKAHVRLQWIHLLDPKNVMAFELKVVCLRSWKKFAECVAIFEQWIEAHPDQIEPRIGLSEMWLHLEQNQRALDAFQEILNLQSNHVMALLGVAQAKLKLDADPLAELRKAWMLDQDYTREMIEEHLDFRGMTPQNLEPMSLTQLAKTYGVSLKRVINRARSGSLPMHPPAHEGGLMQFNRAELDRHHDILRKLGFEIQAGAIAKTENPTPGSPQGEQVAVQQSLFDGP